MNDDFNPEKSGPTYLETFIDRILNPQKDTYMNQLISKVGETIRETGQKYRQE